MKKQKLSKDDIIKTYDKCINSLHICQSLDDIKLGSVKKQDLILLNRMLNIDKIESFLEIGSFAGVSFRMFAKMIQPKIAFSVDANTTHRNINKPRKYFHILNNDLQKNMTIVCHDGLWGESIMPETLGRKFDCIFIDADHQYRSVQKDFLLAEKVLEDNGIIILHDIKTWDGVKTFCKDIDSHYDWSIVRTPLNDSHDGFAIIFRTSDTFLPF